MINCHGIVGEYPYIGTYDYIIMGGREGLINAIKEMQPESIIRKE